MFGSKENFVEICDLRTGKIEVGVKVNNKLFDLFGEKLNDRFYMENMKLIMTCVDQELNSGFLYSVNYLELRDKIVRLN
jgi:hypothetical protein